MYTVCHPEFVTLNKKYTQPYFVRTLVGLSPARALTTLSVRARAWLDRAVTSAGTEPVLRAATGSTLVRPGPVGIVPANSGSAMLRFTLVAIVALAEAHTQMNWPPIFQDTERIGSKPGWRRVGCTEHMVPSGTRNTTTGHTSMTNTGCACTQYTNFTFIPGNVTIADDSPLRTAWVFDSSSGTPKKLIHEPLGPLGPKGEQHPWRAPGTAPTYGAPAPPTVHRRRAALT
eukprot:COSAG06_NODE_5120_length_3707_cov_2.040188_1_plen_230_part_00